MRWPEIVDIKEVKKTIDALKPNHQLFEIRILGADKRKVLSGYFTDADALIEAFDKVDLRGTNIYITLNAINSALYSRIQHDRFVANTNTTSDTEVDSYQWLFIDLDPVRPANISSSDEELLAAEQLKWKIKKHLAELGFPDPVEALSGNGHHLLYRIDLPVTDENIQLVNDCLSTLAVLFNNTSVKVDTTNSNPSRICKLHGTLAQKGASTQERPHRMSRLLVCPEHIEIASKDLLEGLVAEMPEDVQKPKMRPAARTIQMQTPFDIKDFMLRHGMTYKEDVGRDCQIYLLDECPFDHNHRNGDSKIFAYTDGAIAFKCHHNSCKGKKWQDVRLLFEPDAYDRQLSDERIESGYAAHKASKKRKAQEPEIPLPGDEPPKKKKSKKGPRPIYKAADLMKEHFEPPRVIVGVGSDEPMLVEGTCILSAKPKLGKSWFVLDMCIAVSRGEEFLGYQTEKCSTLYLDLETSKQLQQSRIRKALAGRDVPDNFYIGNEADTLDDGFIEQIEHYLSVDPKIGLVVIDVFQIIRSRAISFKEQEYDHAYRDITPLNKLAQDRHIAIILVCHDRKMVDPDDPFSNILGSTGLQGAATQMIVMFRNRKTDPIHISIKGKTIDALPELNVQLTQGQWSRVESGTIQDPELAELDAAYQSSDIRKAVIKIAEHESWRGKCSQMIDKAVTLGMNYFDTDVTPKMVGAFLHKHKSRFAKYDHVGIEIIKNGEAGKIYKIYKLPLMTVDGEEEVPLMGWEDASIYAGYSNPYL